MNKGFLRIVVFIIGSYIGRNLLTHSNWQDRMPESFYREGHFFAKFINLPNLTPMEKKFVERIKVNPPLKQYFDQYPRRHRYDNITDKVQNGVTKLDDASLLTRVTLIKAIIDLAVSKNKIGFCAEAWRGPTLLKFSNSDELEKPFKDEIMDLLNELPEEQQDLWADLSVKALEAEVTQKPAISVDQQRTGDELVKILKTLTPSDVTRFRRIATNPTLVNNDDGCWAMQQVLNFIEHNADADAKAVLARAFAAH